jgi:hypothetical protein
VTLGSLPRRFGRLGELALEPSSDRYEGEEVSAAKVTAARAPRDADPMDARFTGTRGRRGLPATSF